MKYLINLPIRLIKQKLPIFMKNGIQIIVSGDDFFRNFVHVSVLRYKCEKVSYEAAEMSELLFNEIERYSLHPSLRKVSKNHCTKYVWQSFFYSQSRDVLWQLTDGMKLVIVPSLFIYGSKGVFQKVLTFSY